jgi:RHS repeat-associated protein
MHRATGPAGVEFAEFEDYTPDGKPGFLYQGNGTSTTFSHDNRSNLLQAIRIQAPSLDPADDLFHKTYRYTPGGDIKEITDHIQSSTRYYSYDKLHRLISEKSSTLTMVHPSKVVRLEYEYDGTGPFHAPKRIASRGRRHDLQYDANGNLVEGPALADPQSVTRRVIRYTPDNMPSRIDQAGARCAESPSGAPCPANVEFLYDGENRRVMKTSPSGSTHYVGRHFHVQNGVPIRYVFAGDLRLAKITSNGIRYYHKDHLMSTVAFTDEGGKRIETADYLPFGQARNRMGDLSTAFRYTDQEFDWETGLYNYRARMYDPVSAVFMGPDPYLSANRLFLLNGLEGKHRMSRQAIMAGANTASGPKPSETRQLIAFFGETSQRLNRYAYVQNSPVNYVDSNGLWPERIHHKIIDFAFEHLPIQMISQIQEGSNYADSWKHQGPDFNHMHAMRQKGESAEAANDKMQEFVSVHMKEYSRLMEAGQPEKAYFALGMALHPIMDSTSPSHEGFPVWEGLINTPGYKLIGHFIMEQNISPERLQKTIEIMKQAME